MNAYARALRLLFSDRMTVWRNAARTRADGVTETYIEEEPIAKDVPCRISYRGSSSTMRSDDPRFAAGENPAESVPLIVCPPDADVKSGDFISVTRRTQGGDATYSGWAGAPNRYVGSLQFLIHSKEAS